jgi:catechol 2,3-dioxygenase-like lactoylglutathione lyase family enzyme
VRVDHTVVHVTDAAASAEWYRRVLGAEVVELSWGRTAFVIGEARLHVHAPDSTPHPRPARPAGPGSGDLCLEWPGTAAEAVSHLSDAGVAVLEGPVPRQAAKGIGQSVYLHDPDGNLLELISYAPADAERPFG